MRICADMHTHSVASTHAFSTVMENLQYAKKAGLTAIALTDHTAAMPDAPHIWHFGNLKVFPRTIDDVILIKGAEVNVIDHDGNIDMLEKDIVRLEWVVASMHKETVEPSTIENHNKAYRGLAKNNHVDVIGHPATDMFRFDYEEILKVFKEYEKLVEINESSIHNKSGALENTIEIAKLCKKLEVPVIVNSDSHFCLDIGHVPTALRILEDIDFPEKLVINSNWDKLSEFILKKRSSLNL